MQTETKYTILLVLITSPIGSIAGGIVLGNDVYELAVHDLFDGYANARYSDVLEEEREGASIARRAMTCLLEEDGGEGLIQRWKERFWVASQAERQVLLDVMTDLPARSACMASPELAELALTGNAYEAVHALRIMRKGQIDPRIIDLAISGVLHRFRASDEESLIFGPRRTALITALEYAVTVLNMDRHDLDPSEELIVLAIKEPIAAKVRLFEFFPQSLANQEGPYQGHWVFDLLACMPLRSDEADDLALEAREACNDWISLVGLCRSLLKAAPNAVEAKRLLAECFSDSDDRLAQCVAADFICHTYADTPLVVDWCRASLDSPLDQQSKAKAVRILLSASLSDADRRSIAYRGIKIDGDDLCQEAICLLGRVSQLTQEDLRWLHKLRVDDRRFVSWQARIALDRHN